MGAGGGISDFLLATASTGNIAIIEIKTPAVELTTKRAYRHGVYGISTELGGPVVQILDQRHKLQKNFLNLKDESGRHDIHAYAVQCVVIAGRTPADGSQRKSLELARNSLSDVTIVTFDELLARLKEVYSAISSTDKEASATERQPLF